MSPSLLLFPVALRVVLFLPGFVGLFLVLATTLCSEFLSFFLSASRAGKTEVLTDDLHAADKHVDQIRAALTGLSKRLCNIPSQSGAQDPAHKEKRLVSLRN